MDYWERDDQCFFFRLQCRRKGTISISTLLSHTFALYTLS